jgi:hypothetical protein
MRMFWLLLLPSVIAGLGCDTVGGEKGCTLIGCLNRVEIKTSDPNGASLSVISGTAKFDGRTITVDCSSGSVFPCGGGFSFDIDVDARGSVELDIRDDAGRTYRGTVEPTFTETEPNGPGCGICVKGVASVTLQ